MIVNNFKVHKGGQHNVASIIIINNIILCKGEFIIT